MHPESGMDWLRSHALALPLLVKGRAEKDLRVGSVLRKTASVRLDLRPMVAPRTRPSLVDRYAST
jgi:hypothetical protein